MATLQNTQINQTYVGLIKTTDNAIVDGTLKALTDGLGNNLPIEVSTTGVNFTGTVTGISAGGLISGTSANSMISAPGLTTLPAVSNNVDQIILGNNATGASAGAGFGISLGTNSAVNHEYGIAIGHSAQAHYRNVAIGRAARTGTRGQNIAIGDVADASGNDGCIAIGASAEASGLRSTAIGYASGNVTGANTFAVSIGYNNGFANGVRSTAVGQAATAKAEDSAAFGSEARVDNSGHAGAVCIGHGTQSTNAGTVTLGRNLTAVNWVDSTTTNRLALVDYANLNFADDTAAATGGVPLGGIYHNAGALRIRIA
jgi:hypothetical protein